MWLLGWGEYNTTTEIRIEEDNDRYWKYLVSGYHWIFQHCQKFIALLTSNQTLCAWAESFEWLRPPSTIWSPTATYSNHIQFCGLGRKENWLCKINKYGSGQWMSMNAWLPDLEKEQQTVFYCNSTIGTFYKFWSKSSWIRDSTVQNFNLRPDMSLCSLPYSPIYSHPIIM